MNSGFKILDRTMTIDEQIRFYIDHAKNFMLHGPSGIGKSRRIEEIDPNYISIVLRNDMLPEEVIGKTVYLNSGEAKWIPPIWFTELKKRCELDKEHNHVLFIDEVTNVKPIIQSMIYDIVLNRRIRTDTQSELPKNVSIALAGNSLEESNATYVMPAPLFRRVDGHIYLTLNIDDILTWGSQRRNDNSGRLKMHPVVLGFLSSLGRGEKGRKILYSEYDSEKPPRYAIDPRAWEQISNIIYDNDGVIARELIQNKIGAVQTQSFLSYVTKNHITVEDIVNGNFYEDDLPKDLDSGISMTFSLLGATEENVGIVRQFIGEYLGKEQLINFDVLWAGDDENRLLFIKNLQENKNNFKNIKKIENKSKIEEKDTDDEETVFDLV